MFAFVMLFCITNGSLSGPSGFKRLPALLVHHTFLEIVGPVQDFRMSMNKTNESGFMWLELYQQYEGR